MASATPISICGRAATGRRISTCSAAWGWRSRSRFGVALAQPQRHVVALEGDGSLLMQLGCLFDHRRAGAEKSHHGGHGTTASTRSPAASRPPAAGSRRYVALSRAPPVSPIAPGPPTRRISTGCSRRRSKGGPSLHRGSHRQQAGRRHHRPRPGADPRALHERAGREAVKIVMAGYCRPKGWVASAAHVPVIHVLLRPCID